MTPLIGLDVGWSAKKATCGLAVSGLPAEPGARRYGDIWAAKYRHADLIPVLRRLMSSPACHRGALMVIDAPIGNEGVPRVDRHIDSACSSGGFYNRAQAFPVTQSAGHQLAVAGYELLESVRWLPWLGGALPEVPALLVAEYPLHEPRLT